eukprot:gene20090-39705_t
MLALAMGCALIRLLKGPSAQDRVLALDCMYLSGMLVMLVLALFYSFALMVLGLEVALPIGIISGLL